MRNGFVAAGLVLLTVCAADAQPTPTAALLTDYTPTSWNEKDGLPSSRVRSIAQDGEGYLWLGTDAGLVRFDGTRFVAFGGAGVLLQLPQTAIGLVCVARDQTTWISFVEGVVSHITRDRVVNYDRIDGSSPGAVTALVEGANAVMWLGSEAGLYRFDGQQWALWSGDIHHLPIGPVSAVFAGANGHLLVALADGIYTLGGDQATFRLMQALDQPVRDVTEDRSGTVWITDPVYGFRALAETGPFRRGPERANGTRLLFDRRGDLWVGTLAQGIWRVESPRDSHKTVVLKASVLNGLSGNGVRCLVEDRDGNVWVGNSGGLNRLTPKKASAITDLGIVRSVQSSVDGRLWVGTVDQMVCLSPTTGRPCATPLKFPASYPPATDVDQDGTVWIAANATLTQISRAGVSRWGLARQRPLRQIESIASDSHGGVWIYDRREGLLRWHDGELERFPAADLLTGAQVVTSHADSRGAAWLAFDDGTVARVTATDVRLFGPRDGLDGGVSQAIYEDRDYVMWFAGTRGLSRSIGDGRFQTFHVSNGLPAEPLTAIVADEQMALWIAGTSGIYRIAAEELKKAQDAPTYRLHYAVLDSSDGVAGHPLSAGFGNRLATRATDGRLWFVTGRGLTIIDPSVVRRNHAGLRAPHIDQVIANGQPLSAAPFLHLPTGTTRIDIHYDVIDLTAPHKTRFRYKLDDVDSDWQDAGSSRQVSYANLGPRRYRFHVAANDESGNWTATERRLDFDIPPAFYQTRWFLALCACLSCFAVWGIWWLRLRQIQRQFAVRLEERTRLGREIHDTLLQSMVGIALQCEVIAGDAGPAGAVPTDHLLRLRRQVEGHVRELRQAIWTLRSPQAPIADLASALHQAGERATEGPRLEFEFAVAGFPRPCSSEVEDQLLRIGQEAVLNAVRHADATHVKMELRYEESAIALRVSDNGRGFEVLNAGKTMDGHYGLIGMRERAAIVGGALHLNSSGDGTEVEAIVPTAAFEVSA